MAKRKLSRQYVSYSPQYGGRSLRCGAAEGLRRVEAALARCATSLTPSVAKLTIYEEQCQALFEATAGDGPGDHDPHDARTGSGQASHPLAVAAEALFGPGEASVMGCGAGGDLWQTSWELRIEDAGGADRFAAMSAFVMEHEKAAPIHLSWSHREQGAADWSPIALELYYDPIWTSPDSDEPLPDQHAGGHRQILAFLGSQSSAIFALTTPFELVDEHFAAWERAFCEAAQVQLSDARWLLRRFDDEGFCVDAQGRYRRADWTDAGRKATAKKGPWDKLLDTLVAPRLSFDQQYETCKALDQQPRGAAAAGLLERLKSLKGAPLERGCSALSDWARDEATRAELERAVRAFLADPPAAKQCRDVATALGAASGDDWLCDLALEHLQQKKIPPVVAGFIEELYIHDSKATAPERRAAVLVTALRVHRAKGAAGRRATFRNCLAGADSGPCWPTWLLEADAAHPKFDGYDNHTWATDVFSRWPAHKVVDPAAAKFRAHFPSGDVDWSEPPYPLEVVLTDEERAELLELERQWLGLPG